MVICYHKHLICVVPVRCKHFAEHFVFEHGFTGDKLLDPSSVSAGFGTSNSQWGKSLDSCVI